VTLPLIVARAGTDRLDVDGRELGARGQIAPHLVYLGADLRQRAIRVVVEPEARADGRQILLALELDGVDAVSGRDRAFER